MRVAQRRLITRGGAGAGIVLERPGNLRLRRRLVLEVSQRAENTVAIRKVFIDARGEAVVCRLGRSDDNQVVHRQTVGGI